MFTKFGILLRHLLSVRPSVRPLSAERNETKHAIQSSESHVSAFSLNHRFVKSYVENVKEVDNFIILEVKKKIVNDRELTL